MMDAFYKKESSKVSGKQHQMKCACCDKILGTLLESSEEIDKKVISSNTLIKYKCICSCGGDTFFVNCYSKCYFIPLHNINIVRMDWVEKQSHVENIIVLETL